MLLFKIMTPIKIKTYLFICISIGLSIFIMMIIGLLSVPFFFLFQVRLLSKDILSIIIWSVISTMMIYLGRKDIRKELHFPLVIPGYETGLILLLPILAILGTSIMNVYNNNIIIISFLALIVSIIPLIAFDKIKEKNYPWLIFSIALALLLHRSLISTNLWGSDIFEELYYSNSAKVLGYWNPSLYSNLNSMASVTILPNIIALFSGTDLVTTYKAFFPFLCSFGIIGLYDIFKNQVSEKVAFISIFYFISLAEFFGVLPALIRQEIGFIFFVLLLAIILTNELTPSIRTILTIIFGISLILSHYALSFLFLFIIVFYIIIFWIIKYYFKFNNITTFFSTCMISEGFVAIFASSLLGWSIYTAGSSIFDSIVSIFRLIADNLVDEFFNPGATEGLAIVGSQSTSMNYSILRWLYYLAITLLSLGLLYSSIIIKNEKRKLTSVCINTPTICYILLSIAAYVLLVSSIIVPYYSGNLGTVRLFQISLILLSPFIIIGLYWLMSILGRLMHRVIEKRYAIYFFSIFLAVTFIFNSGLAMELTNDQNPSSISLSTQDSYRTATYLYSDDIISGINFISETNNQSNIYADIFSRQPLRSEIWPKERIITLRQSNEDLTMGDVVILKFDSSKNITIFPDKKISSVERPYLSIHIENTNFYKELLKINKIYIIKDLNIYAK